MASLREIRFYSRERVFLSAAAAEYAFSKRKRTSGMPPPLTPARACVDFALAADGRGQGVAGPTWPGQRLLPSSPALSRGRSSPQRGLPAAPAVSCGVRPTDVLGESSRTRLHAPWEPPSLGTSGVSAVAHNSIGRRWGAWHGGGEDAARV